MTRLPRGRPARAAWAAAVVALGSLAATPHPRDHGQTAPRVIGIVEVPRLFGGISADGNVVPPAGGPVSLRERATADSRVVATLASADLVESAEFTYEQAGALVYGRERDWSLLRTRDGTAGWLAPADDGAFHPFENLLADGAVYLTDAWDGTIGATPGAGRRTAVPPDPRRQIVGFLEGAVLREQVVLQPGEDPDPIRDRYRATGARVGRPRADGTRLLTLEVGVTHALYERADRAAPVVAEVETHRTPWVLATTQNVPSRVPVFSRRAGWYEVALRADEWREARRVWLVDSITWRFQAFAEPDSAAGLMANVWGPVTQSARVTGFRLVDGQLWAEVEVLRDSPCEVADEPVIVARGWVPAHDAAGAPTLWFHSRGC